MLCRHMFCFKYDKERNEPAPLFHLYRRNHKKTRENLRKMFEITSAGKSFEMANMDTIELIIISSNGIKIA